MQNSGRITDILTLPSLVDEINTKVSNLASKIVKLEMEKTDLKNVIRLITKKEITEEEYLFIQKVVNDQRVLF